jgi:hypothetical protein
MRYFISCNNKSTTPARFMMNNIINKYNNVGYLTLFLNIYQLFSIAIMYIA